MTIDISSNIVEYHLPPLAHVEFNFNSAAYGDGSIFRLPHDLLVIFNLDRSFVAIIENLNSSIPITLILCGKIIDSVQFYLSLASFFSSGCCTVPIRS
jgi:hypothetical protein